MCGIAGIVDLNNGSIESSRTFKATVRSPGTSVASIIASVPMTSGLTVLATS